MEITRDNYYEYEAIGSSKLADFYDSPDVALMPPKGVKEYFEIGNIFESIIEEFNSDSKPFSDKYCIVDEEIKLDETLIACYDKPELIQGALDAIKRTKAGDVYAVQKPLYDSLLLLQANRKLPISTALYNKVMQMVNNFHNIEIFGIPLRESLQNAEFQMPITWLMPDTNLMGKALIDIVLSIEIDGHPMILLMDIKTTANLIKFKQQFRNRYWVQDRHYIDGAKAVFGEDSVYPYMFFLAASKEEPYLGQPFRLAEASEIGRIAEYKRLTIDYYNWVELGQPPRGWKDLETINIEW